MFNDYISVQVVVCCVFLKQIFFKLISGLLRTLDIGIGRAVIIPNHGAACSIIMVYYNNCRSIHYNYSI